MASFKGRWRLAFMPRVFLLAVIAIFSANLCLVLVKGLAADAFPLLTGIAYIGSLLPRGLSVVSALGTRPSRAMNPPLLGDGRAFIYVYEIGSEWNTKLADAKVRWWSQQYEPEYELFELLARQNVSRTDDPEMATLFYVPFFAARYLLLQHEDDTADMMKQVVEKTSQKWTELLTKIKKEYPYFARYNGQDHFAALTMDHGRCTALTFSDPAVYGEMFFLQLNADKMVRSNHATTSRGIQALTFNYKAPVAADLPDIPCYMADRDIPIPPISTSSDITRPRESERPITALFRFSAGQHHGVPIPHFNHFIRKELLEVSELFLRPPLHPRRRIDHRSTPASCHWLAFESVVVALDWGLEEA